MGFLIRWSSGDLPPPMFIQDPPTILQDPPPMFIQDPTSTILPYTPTILSSPPRISNCLLRSFFSSKILQQCLLPILIEQSGNFGPVLNIFLINLNYLSQFSKLIIGSQIQTRRVDLSKTLVTSVCVSGFLLEFNI